MENESINTNATVGIIAPVTPIVDMKKADGNRILEIRVKRNDASELEIHLKSSRNWKFLAHKTEVRPIKIGGVDCWYPAKDRLSGVNGMFYAENVMVVQEKINLNLLLAKDIQTTSKFNFGALPISETTLNNLINDFKLSVKAIFLEFMKPIDIRVCFTTQSVERSQED